MFSSKVSLKAKLAVGALALLSIVTFQNFSLSYDPALQYSENAKIVPQESGRFGHLSDVHRKAVENNPRIVINNDGNDFILPAGNYKTLADRREAFLSSRMKRYRMESSQVDTVYYDSSSGFGYFKHRTNVGSTLDHTFRGYENLLADPGADALRMVVDYVSDVNKANPNRVKPAEVFWSLRMNDKHDAGADDFLNLFAPYKLANPSLIFNPSTLTAYLSHCPSSLQATPLKCVEWMREQRNKFLDGKTQFDIVGEMAKDWKKTWNRTDQSWTSMNYSAVATRRFIFTATKEVLTNYDVAGVELNFMRHIAYFPRNMSGVAADASEIAKMTELMRNMRRLANAAANARGKPVKLAIQIPDSFEYCKYLGLDIKQWAKEGLFDILIGPDYFEVSAPGSMANWAHAQKPAIQFYPNLSESRQTIDESTSDPREDLAAYRGRAALHLRRGADAIYLFNDKRRKERYYDLGSEKMLRTLPKRYYMSYQGTGASPFRPPRSMFTSELLSPNPRNGVADQVTLAKLGATYSGKVLTYDRIGSTGFKFNGLMTLRIRTTKQSDPKNVSYLLKLKVNGVEYFPSNLAVSLYPENELEPSERAANIAANERVYKVVINVSKALGKFGETVDIRQTSATGLRLQDIWVDVTPTYTAP